MRLGTYYRYELLKRIGVLPPIKRNDKILDIGGFDGFILSKTDAASKTVIDMNVEKKFEKIKYIENDFFNERFGIKKFDIIFCFDVLEHVPAAMEKNLFLQINKILEKKGKSYITVPSKDIRVFPGFMTNLVSKGWGHNKCKGYSEKELEALANGTGLNYEISRIGSRNYLNSYLFLRIARIFLPEKFVRTIIAKIAEKDSKNLEGNNGYYLVKLMKAK
jgi:SAM-dependent methyltransferase